LLRFIFCRMLLAGLAFVAILLQTGCSTSTANVRDVMDEVDRSELGFISMAIVGDDVQVSSQDSERLFELHNNEAQVIALAKNVARVYGFDMQPAGQAEFVLDLLQVLPDGGACLQMSESVRDGVTYTASVMTFGMVPAKGAHCLVAVAALYRGRVADENLIAEFVANDGWVRLYAGVGDLPDYRKTVTYRDEVRAMEASFGGLFNELINEGAFK